MAPPTLAIIAAGAMGSAVARRLTDAGCTVLTNLDGRSAATRARAAIAGMQDVPLPELASRAQWVLSILPPIDAFAFAQQYLAARADVEIEAGAADAVFADCNAVSPHTSKRIASLFASSPIKFVDAGIIGGPPSDGYDPVFYASVAPQDEVILDAFVALTKYGLKITPLTGEGADIGDASALKMSYAGIAKGITGLCTTMILSAHASSPATATALLHELRSSQPAVLGRLTRSIPDMLPKAYRWGPEMKEISAFVREGEGATGSAQINADEGLSNVHQGLASLYERIARGVKEEEAGGAASDIRVLKSFVEEAKRLDAESSK